MAGRDHSLSLLLHEKVAKTTLKLPTSQVQRVVKSDFQISGWPTIGKYAVVPCIFNKTVGS